MTSCIATLKYEYYAFYMHNNTPASELMAAAENARDAASQSQEQIARVLGMTQGHYSKLAAGKVKPGPRAEASIRRWLDQQATTPPDAGARRAEMRRLAAEITMHCMRLTELASKG